MRSWIILTLLVSFSAFADEIKVNDLFVPDYAVLDRLQSVTIVEKHEGEHDVIGSYLILEVKGLMSVRDCGYQSAGFGMYEGRAFRVYDERFMIKAYPVIQGDTLPISPFRCNTSRFVQKDFTTKIRIDVPYWPTSAFDKMWLYEFATNNGYIVGSIEARLSRTRGWELRWR